MIRDFLVQREKGIAIAANVCGVATALAGGGAYFFSLGPWPVAAVAVAGLCLALAALAAARQRLRQVEHHLLALARRHLSGNVAAYKESLQQGRKPGFAEVGYLLAALQQAERHLGGDTAESDKLLVDLLQIEAEHAGLPGDRPAA